jgi:hypothetical protein
MNNYNYNLIQKIKAVRVALSDLEQHLSEQKLPRITKDAQRRLYSDEMRDKLYHAIDTLDKTHLYTPDELREWKPSNTSMNMLGRSMRDCGWTKKSVRTGDKITNKWVYIDA